VNLLALPRKRTYEQEMTWILLMILEVLALGFPAIINKGPLVYPDTRAYFMGGHAAIQKFLSVFSHGAGANTSAVNIDQTLQKAHGVRSAFYSIFTYLPTVTVSLTLVVVLQILIVVAALRFLFHLAHPAGERWQATAFIVALGLLTTVSWCASNVMPDIFTPVMALCLAMTMIYWPRLKLSGRLGLGVGIAGGLVMHITNLPIAIFILLVGIFVCGRQAIGRYVLPIAAIGGGVAAMLAVGVVGFHQWSISPQSPPFLLARSLEDGPAKLYLRAHCPTIGLTMCRHLDGLDQNTTKFIWDSDGVYSTASAEDQAALRREDKRIFVAAAMEYPWLQIRAMAKNVLTQLGLFSIHEYFIPSHTTYTTSEMAPIETPPQQLWQTLVSIPQYLIVIASVITVVQLWRSLPADLKQLAMLVVATVLIEAAAGAFSEPVPRYQARVIWLVPMVATLAWLTRRNNVIRAHR
jgi:hypothetical protein